MDLKLTRLIQVAGCAALLLMGGLAHARGSVCEGDQKIEGAYDHNYVPGSGNTVESVCIKAGRDAQNFQCGDTDASGCYTIEWGDNCASAHISGGGTGRDCKEISHTAATFGICEGEGCGGDGGDGGDGCDGGDGGDGGIF